MRKLFGIVLSLFVVATSFNVLGVYMGQRPTTRAVQQGAAGGHDVHLYYNIDKSHFTSSGVGGSTNIGYAIPRGGYFLLTENCEVATIATPSSNSMLYIAQPNVVVDLGTFAVGENTGTSCSAGVVYINEDNVTIKNGTIANSASGIGIKVAAGKKDIKLANLTIIGCVSHGIHLAGTTGSATMVRSVQITNCNINGVTSSSAAIYGILADFTEDLIIEDVNIATLDATGQSADGVKLNNCSHVTMKNVSVANSSTTTSGVLNGIHLTASTDCTLENCSVKANSSASEIYGIQVTAGSHCNVLKNCDIFDNTGADTSIGVNVTKATTASNYNSVENCRVVYQRGSSTTALEMTAGFRSGGSVGNMFIDCVARGCSAGENNNVYGFILDTDDGGANLDEGAYIQNCTAKSNESVTTTGTAYGIYIYADIADAIILDNKLYDNKGVTAGYGIYDASSDSRCLFQRNFAYHNMKSDGTVDNYYVLPDGTAADFPVATGHVNNFSIYEMRNENYNWEILG